MAEYIERDTVLAQIKDIQSADPLQIGKKQFADGFFAGLDEAEVVLVGAVSADVAPVVKELRPAVRLLHQEYERAKNNPIVRNPLAYALYQTWKVVDGARMDGE